MAAEASHSHQDLASLRIARPTEQPRRKRNPYGSAMLAIVVVTIVAVIAYSFYVKTVGRPLTVQTMMVTASAPGPSGVLLTGSGYVVTRHKYITIGTKILGQIVDEPIEEGQHVKAGDVLARIDDRDYQAQLRQAIAARDLAQANLTLSQSRAARTSKLFETGTVSKDEFDTAISASVVAQAELEQDIAAVDYARFNVNQCVISSPIDGIVLKKYRELGDTINFGGQIQAGGGATDIAQLADTEDMRAEVDINEVDIAKIGLGSSATVVLDSYPDRQFAATLVKVYPEADRQKGTVKIEVHIDAPDLKIIKPEMSTKVSFLATKPSATDVPCLTVPKSAVKTEGNQSYLWTVRDGAAHRVAVERGREMETSTEIIHGVREGETVIVAPPASLKDGQRIATAP